MFEIQKLETGVIWETIRDTFTAKVYVPTSAINGQVINLGFDAPLLIVLEEEKQTRESAVKFAETSGLAKIAAASDASIVFVSPNTADGWQGADASLYQELLSQIKMGPLYHDGVFVDFDFFGVHETTYKIRGTKFRTYVYGFGASADYIATHLMKTIEGEYLWGPGEITPAVVSLERVSRVDCMERKDIPVISVGNTDAINQTLSTAVDAILVKEQADYVADYETFVRGYKRWCGVLSKDALPKTRGIVEEYGIHTVHTSIDNTNAFKGTKTHPVGYFAWYNEHLLENGPVPTLLAFHGGGDSALHIAKMAGWMEVAHAQNFLLIAIENHMDVTATEAMELMDYLETIYPIDKKHLYATGFSMGGCKTWDLFQEYPERFAALAPMCATFDVGINMFGKPAPRVNRDVMVPVFYAGGELSHLPELPFEEEKVLNRIKYLLEVDQANLVLTAEYADKENWPNKVWGIDGDRFEVFHDDSRDANLTIQYFMSKDGVERIALGSVDNQVHECRQHTCEKAWEFIRQFSK